MKKIAAIVCVTVVASLMFTSGQEAQVPHSHVVAAKIVTKTVYVEITTGKYGPESIPQFLNKWCTDNPRYRVMCWNHYSLHQHFEGLWITYQVDK